jgi:hypothetical protein
VDDMKAHLIERHGYSERALEGLDLEEMHRLAHFFSRTIPDHDYEDMPEPRN